MTATQKIWLGVLKKMALAYPTSRYADLDAAALISTARVFADELAVIPAERIRSVCAECMGQWLTSFAPNVGDFRAAWNRTLIAAPRETFQEIEAREEAAAGFKALMSGQDEMPLFVQIHRRIGRPVVCACKFKDGVRRAATVTRIGSMDRWICGSGECNFDIDATDESAVRAATVAPLIGTGMPEPMAAAASISPASQTRAQLLAEEAELIWEDCTPEQKKDLHKMGWWCDTQRPLRVVSRINFLDTWNDFQAAKEAAA